ncbi:helix-turn-helix domain-containing protein [Nocardia sp. NPDC059177]|uniref:helix-turn-helix domain-containing protein n=1 Tax=Nocardia sp. NPDC059177 TaxID=3346759 RepID=UPI0036A3FCAE
MKKAHSSIADDPVLAAKRDTEEYRSAREIARVEIALGRAVFKRRTALGMSQTELARRAQTTQPAVSRLEAGGGGIPTLAVLDRLGRALGVRFALSVGADSDTADEILGLTA